MTEKTPNARGASGLTRRSVLTHAAAGAAALTAAPALTTFSQAAGPAKLKIGLVTPKSGPLAPFGATDDFVIGQIKPLLEKGIEIGGQTYGVEIVVKDSQSNPSRASEVASELIDGEKVNLLVAAGTADTTNPTADQAEAAGVPCVTTDTPWQAHFFGRRGDPKKGFDWTYHFFWGLKEISSVYVGLWNLEKTNKVIGSLWSHDPDGVAIRGGVKEAVGADGGFKMVDAGLFNPGSTDFSAQIAQFKAANVEIVTGLFIPPDFATFWTQAAQQGFRPKVCTIAKAILFPQTVNALGERGDGLSSELWWSPYHPFKSSLTGASAAQLCEAFTAATNGPWTPPLGFKHAVFEVAIDALKRAKSTKPADIRDALAKTDLATVAGQVAFAKGPVPNIATTPLVGGQWVKSAKGGYEEQVVYNATAPAIPVNAKLKLLA